MESWNRIKMSNADLTLGKPSKLQDEFEDIFMLSKPTKEFAMFGNRRFESDNHVFYFSAEAVKSPLVKILMNKYSATPCEQPQKNEVSLLVGYADSWDILETA